MKKKEKIVRGKNLPGIGNRANVSESVKVPGKITRQPGNGSLKLVVPIPIVPQQNRAKSPKNGSSTGQNARPPEALPGDPIAPEALPGDPIAPEALPGDPITPEALPGDPIAPEALPGDLIAPEALPGDPIAPEALAAALHISAATLQPPEVPGEPVSPAAVVPLDLLPSAPATVPPERAERDLSACEAAVQWDTYRRRLRDLDRSTASAEILRAAGEIVLESAVYDRVESAGGVARYAERVDAVDKLRNRFCIEYVRDVYNLLLLGLSDSEIETFLGVDKGTVDVWASRYPSFRRVLRDGRDRACSAVARAMYQKAIGYRTVKHKQALLGGKVVDFKEEVVFPPDVVAQKFILCNRQPDRWKERQTVDLGELGDLGDLLDAARKRVEGGTGPAVSS